jgi:putative ABC transport system permease protein
MNNEDLLKKEPRPPRWATRFLEWYCRREIVEDLQGDLNEYFERNVNTKGLRSAQMIYIMDVLKFFRSYTIRKPKFVNLLIQWIMIGSYIKTSHRSIVRNKLFSSINIIGLAVSMSVGLLVIAFISDLTSYDDFHVKSDRVYRIVTHDTPQGQRTTDLASTTARAATQIKATMPGVESLTLMRRNFGGEVAVGESLIPISGLWADRSFFNVFTFPLIHGDQVTALKEPYSIVLTEKTAIKLFGQTDVLGKSIKLDTTNYVITGVMKDIPRLSHLRFEALGSFATVDKERPVVDGDLYDWANIYMNYIYVLVSEKASAGSIQAGLDKLCKVENAGLQNRSIALSLQSLTEIALGQKLHNQLGPAMMPLVVWILGGLAGVIILSACFNYTNLSIARALRRSREVGIRKVVGARKGQVWTQFITESVLVAVIALVFSFGMFWFLKFQFISLDGFVDNLVTLQITPKLVLMFVLLAITVGVIAGFIPALFFAKIQAVKVLKDVSSIQLFRRVNLRKALIVVQYVFSLIFITTTVVGYQQYKSFLSFDLGFSTENIINISLNGVNSDQLTKHLNEVPEVTGISRSLLVTSLGSNYGGQVKHKKSNDSTGVYMNVIDEHYLPLHSHQLIAGRNFKSRAENATEDEAIVNEQLLKRFGLDKKGPEHAIGEVISFDHKDLTIIGVVKDFHYETIEDPIEPMILRYLHPTTFGYVNVKISSNDIPGTLARIESAWKKLDNIHPLNAQFYDDQIEKAYSQFLVMIKVIGFLGFLAICISSMGLFGMVVFTTETKMKEISIRKVHGASESSLIFLLSRGFLFLLLLAGFIALPVTYFFFDKVILAEFVYHEPIGFIELVAGLIVVLAIALLMIGSQTWRVAKTNPAHVLKSE